MKQNQFLQQKQALNLSQTLRQSINILQLSTFELAEYITKELEQNPLLLEKEPEKFSTQERHYTKHFSKDKEYNVVENAAYDKTLKQYLIEQIELITPDAEEKQIALYLADLVDENGYLTNDDLQVPDQLLQKLQQLEPTGVFARNLSECLRLQLAEKNLLNNAMQSLLDNLELLAKGQFKALAQLCGVTEQQLHPMIAEIKKLDPKPGRKFASEATGFIYPDILVHKNAAGNFIIELNNELLPQFEVQRDYYHQLKSSGNACVNQYLSEHFKNANHLIYSLKQREKTLLKVTEMLIEKQSHFFNYGSSYIVPMTLKTIADAVNMHESTISRITTNKYIGTEFGIFELKYFFSSSINKTNSSQNCSSTIVKDMIKNLVNHEDAPLSDEEIVEILKVRQINIARRTVAKYREEMKIPNSTQRKQEKLLNNI